MADPRITKLRERVNRWQDLDDGTEFTRAIFDRQEEANKALNTIVRGAIQFTNGLKENSKRLDQLRKGN